MPAFAISSKFAVQSILAAQVGIAFLFLAGEPRFVNRRVGGAGARFPNPPTFAERHAGISRTAGRREGAMAESDIAMDWAS